MNTSETTLSALLAEVARCYADDSAPDATYQAAVSAAQAELDHLASALPVSAEDADVDSPEDLGGGLYADYSIGLTVGAKTITAKGWYVCGWIAAGASQDLDGSGLANWGSSQRGGWSCCDSDGATSGAIRAEADDATCKITVRGGYNQLDHTLDVAELLGLTDEDAEIVREHLRVPAGLVERIQDAIDGAKVAPDEPSAEDIYDQLDDVKGLDGIRVGTYHCAEYIFVGADLGNTRTIQRIDSGDDSLDQDIAEAVADAARAAVLGEARRLIERSQNR